MESSQLNPVFREKMANLTAHILNTAPSKVVKGQKINGQGIIYFSMYNIGSIISNNSM